jgi:alpha-N-acetylglucosaminidase
MKRNDIFYVVTLLLLPVHLMAGSFDGVQGLIARCVPWLSGHVRFVAISRENGLDVAELQTVNGMLVVKASGENAAAVGINRYLEDYCHRSMSHMGDNLAAVAVLPVIEKQVKINATARYRYALNYCTYNYTMSFYNWKNWTHELDWMALHGVNTMLVANGEEAVWQNTLRRLGYTQKEIEDYIPGPAFNAWWLMGNLEGWGGPMPQTQIDSRKTLVQRMLARMRALGIEPVMPGFYGMVPTTLKYRVKAHIVSQGKWAGGFQRPDVLDPCDTAFARIAGIFYEETRKLYGANLRFFSGDPFHEGGISAGIDLTKAGASIQKAMQRYFPGAIWVLQGWQDNPRKEMLAGVDKSAVLIQELAGESTHNWETRKGYEGTPFIWCTVTNFGGKAGVQGKLQRFADEVYRASNGPYAAEMRGVGIMPEGIDNNPVAYDLTLELGWHKDKPDVDKWIKKYALARYGETDKDIEDGWKLLLQTAYGSMPGHNESSRENILCARPALKINAVSTWGGIKKGYDVATFAEAVKIFAKAAPRFSSSETYRIDLINFTRQVLANRADTVFARIVEAYGRKDMDAFNKETDRFLQLSDETNDLLNAAACYRLSTYQKQALQSGNTPDEKKNNLRNLMTLVTYWGADDPTQGELRDYAYKEWAGMMNSFYRARWGQYFSYLKATLEGKDSTAPDFFNWDRKWVSDHQYVFPTKAPMPLGSMVKLLKFN